MSCSGTQKSDASEAQTHGPSVSSQTLYHCAFYHKKHEYIWFRGGDWNSFQDIKPFMK